MSMEVGALRRAFGRAIREQRLAQGSSLQSVAQELQRCGLSISAPTLWRIEEGQATLPLEGAVLLENWLGLGLQGFARVAERARERAAAAADDDATPEQQLEHAKQLATQGRRSEALRVLRRAELQWDERAKTDPSSRDQLAHCLLWQADLSRRLGHADEGIAIAGRALDAARTNATRIRALVMLLTLHEQTGSIALSRLFAKEVMSEMEGAPIAEQAYASGVLGTFFTRLGESEAAAPWLERAIALSRGLDHPVASEACRLRIHLGYAFHRLGHSRIGIETVERALHEAAAAKHREAMYTAAFTLARVFRELGRLVDSMRQFAHGARVAEDLGFPREAVFAWTQIGQLAEQTADEVMKRRAQRRVRALIRQHGAVGAPGERRHKEQAI